MHRENNKQTSNVYRQLLQKLHLTKKVIKPVMVFAESKKKRAEAASENKNKSPDSLVQELDVEIERGEEFSTQADYPGYYSSIACFLHFAYYESGLSADEFSLSHFPLIIKHLFCPEERILEQTVLPPGNNLQVQFTSTLTQIRYDIRALMLYSRNEHLGRRELWRRCSFPLVTELFKALDYLARLRVLSLERHNSADRFSRFMREISTLTDVEIKALWIFRSSVIHAGVIFANVDGTHWRFSYGLSALGGHCIHEDSQKYDGHRSGRHFSVDLTSLYLIVIRAAAFIEADMKRNPGTYALHPNFVQWFREYWTLQHLLEPSELSNEEQARIALRSPTDPNSGFRPAMGIATVELPIWYDWRRSIRNRVDEIKYRLRDFLSNSPSEKLPRPNLLIDSSFLQRIAKSKADLKKVDPSKRCPYSIKIRDSISIHIIVNGDDPDRPEEREFLRIKISKSGKIEIIPFLYIQPNGRSFCITQLNSGSAQKWFLNGKRLEPQSSPGEVGDAIRTYLKFQMMIGWIKGMRISRGEVRDQKVLNRLCEMVESFVPGFQMADSSQREISERRSIRLENPFFDRESTPSEIPLACGILVGERANSPNSPRIYNWMCSHSGKGEEKIMLRSPAPPPRTNLSWFFSRKPKFLPTTEVKSMYIVF